jgi:RNA polymerase sigma factor (sigma-70 family)
LEYNDLLELIAVGNLAVVEKFDQALMKVRERVTAYLCGVARWTIRNYCLFHSRLIHIPNHEVSLLESAPRIESLDVLFECGDDCDGMQIQAAEQEAPAPNERMNQMLYKALDELTAKEREVVERRYGLHGAPASLADVGRQLLIAPSIVYGRHALAIKHLRKVLLSNS